MTRTFPREQIEEFIQHLAIKYPATFFLEPNLKRPLKKNILLDLEHERVLDDDQREAALSFYTPDWNYENALQAGMKRIDLNGKPAGTVTTQEERDARERVRVQKQELREKKRQDPIAVMYKLHDDGKIPLIH